MKITRCDPSMATRPAPADGMVWYSPAEAPFRLAGFAWFEQEHLYRRLPRKPAPPLPASVDTLAWHTAGGQVAFKTASVRIAIKVRLHKASLFDHMTATGLKGFDLYRGKPGRMQYVATTRFKAQAMAYDATLWNGEQSTLDVCTLNFPLYAGVREVWIGLDKGARVLPPPPYVSADPVVIYGTSITQGGCANRPGMAFSNILSRRLNRPFINLGFSGSGKLEPEVGRHMADASTHPALLVIDADANCGPDLLKERLVPFIGLLRQSHPSVPLLVVSRPPFASDVFQRATHKKWVLARKIQEQAVRRLRKQGDRHIHFLDGSTLMPEAGCESTVDGVHATDLGFWQMAGVLEPVFKRLLKGG
jgi:hypothetical protein